jgi:hypothetical protein
MREAVTLTFVFQSIGIILSVSALAVLLIMYKTKKMKEN